jgi:guanine deaminase
LGLEAEIGSLEAGRTADVCVWDWAVGPVQQRRMEVARALHEKVFAWLILADDRNLAATYVAGVCRHNRAGLPTSAATLC